jgi:copper chaperone
MKELKFNTNIKCMGCVSSVKPILDKESKIINWEVDLESPDKVLTIKSNEMNPQEISELVKRAGYFANEIKEEIHNEKE